MRDKIEFGTEVPKYNEVRDYCRANMSFPTLTALTKTLKAFLDAYKKYICNRKNTFFKSKKVFTHRDFKILFILPKTKMICEV